MTLDIAAALALFAVVTSATPGPNNLMLLASGVNFGFRSTIPHMLGIGAGFLALLLAVGFGIGALIERLPLVHQGLKIAGAAYLVYLAWRIATARSLGEGKGSARPMRFLEAALFQWVNPKAWVMALAAMAAYADPQNYRASVLVIGALFAAVNVPCVAVWAGFGSALRVWLADPARLRRFNLAMGALLGLSLWPMPR